MKVTKDTNIQKLIEKFPQTVKVFLDYGLHCVGCFASQFDTVEEGAKIHGFDEGTIGELLEDLNKVTEDKGG